MNKNEIMASVTRGFHQVGFQLKKHSPEILVVSGVVGVVASAVMACRATTKLAPIVEATKVNAAHIRAAAEKGEAECYLEDGQIGIAPYSEENAKKDLTVIYAKSGLQMVKLYAPAVILGAASITAILSAHRIMHTRNAALAAAYATVDRGFKEYRGRVIERFGKDLDRELRYNIKSKEVEETVVHEDGTESTVKKTVEVINGDDPNNFSMYARCYTNGNTGWDKNPERSLWFLKQQQRWASERLQSRGYLFLNEVYESLGFPITEAGSQVGWVYDANDPCRDNYVDFGIYNEHSTKCIQFVNGEEDSIWLDFNVDGVVWSLLK